MSSTTKRIVVIVIVVAMVATAAGTALSFLLRGGDEPTRTSGDETSTEAAPLPRDPEASVAPSPELEPFYSQELEWEPCEDNQCATLTVPVDYQDAEGETIELAVARVPAAGDSVGALVVNPGGPGSPGQAMAEQSGFYFRDQLLQRMDIIAFDPRGTGESNPIDCLSDGELDDYVGEDPSPDGVAGGRELAANQAEFFQACVDNSDELIGHVSTAEAARDMDVLRAALGDTQLDYLGFSYGTTLGSTYAELFPEQVGRFVLDGATDPTLGSREDSLSQAGGFETALRAYVADCVEGGDCQLGDSVEEGLGTIQDLLAQIESEPMPTSIDDRELRIGNAFYGVVTPLYNEDYWSILTQSLQLALNGNGSGLMLLSDAYGSRENGEYTNNSLEAISAINCLDDPTSVAPAKVPAQFDEFDRVSPTFGRVFAWGLVGCRGIQVTSVEEPLTIRAEGAAPIVVVGTTRDPATPYEEAVALADQLESGLLVTRDGDGHTAYNKGNDCIDEALEGYLIEGEVPEAGLEC